VKVRLGVNDWAAVLVMDGVNVRVNVAVTVKVSMAVVVREGLSVRVPVGLAVKVGVTDVVKVAGRVAVLVPVEVGGFETVEVAVRVSVAVSVKVAGMVDRVTVGVSVGTSESGPKKPQNEGRLPGSTVQAIKDDRITRHNRKFLERMRHSNGNHFNHTAKCHAFLLVFPWQFC
jgi:hypothetical protein